VVRRSARPLVLISIVLPTHNRPHYLRAAVDSVLAQSVTSWELLLVDNGSDEPIDLPADPRVRLLRLPVNGGPAAARNAGLDEADGQVVAFLDDDDLFTPDRLQLGLDGLARGRVAVCGTRFLDDTSAGAVRVLDGDVSDTILDGSTPSVGATMLERLGCPRFDERWKAVEDVEWWLRVAAMHPVTTVTDIGYLVRRHDAPRVGNGPSARVQENLELLEARAEWFAAHRRAAAFRLRRAALIAASSGDRRLARRLLLRSLARRPSVRSSWHLVRTLRPAPQRT
jgi:glycosyltransferase involved in cell wall biosynthesis